MQLRVLAFVLAGGKGTRLYPLTKERAKPAVPFGGRYRIVDFVLSNLVNSGIYSVYAEAARFDMVFVTWGALCWLPDIQGWARIVAHFLKPGGSLYLADAHPAAMVFDDAAALPDGRPGFFAPYFSAEPVVMDEAHDYVDETATVQNATTHTWLHPLGDIISGLLAAGMCLDWLHEHDAVTWRMFKILVQDSELLWRWPDKPWLPLAFSLRATRR